VIAFAVIARRVIGPREVLQAAPLRMRLQFWALVVSGVFLASVPVVAQRGESVPPASWANSWQFIASMVTWVFGAGLILGRMNGVKDTLESKIAAIDKRLTETEASTVKKDSLADKLATIDVKLDALHKMLEQSDRAWRDSLHGSNE
jgi:hypothetical protein